MHYNYLSKQGPKKLEISSLTTSKRDRYLKWNWNLSGMTLVEIMIGVLIISVLAMVAIPYFAKARTDTRKNLCLNHQRVLMQAADRYELAFPDQFQALAPSDRLQVLFTGGFVKKQTTFDCPESTTTDMNDYTFDIDDEGNPSDVDCKIKPSEHAWP